MRIHEEAKRPPHFPNRDRRELPPHIPFSSWFSEEHQERQALDVRQRADQPFRVPMN
jgi:hypothetical protein